MSDWDIAPKRCPNRDYVNPERRDWDMSRTMSQLKPSFLEGLGHWDTWDSGFRDVDAAPPYSADTVNNGSTWREGNPPTQAKDSTMKIDTCDSQKLENLQDDILGLIHALDGYKERTSEIRTVFEERSGYSGASGRVP